LQREEWELKAQVEWQTVKPEDNPNDQLVEHVLKYGDGQSFTKFFWKACEASKKENSQYRKFVTALKLADNGHTTTEISEVVKAPKSTVYTWIRMRQMPKLGHFLKAFMQLGEPALNQVWLTIECTHGHGVPLGPFIQVPTEVKLWSDVERVINQLRPLQVLAIQFDRHYLFGFLLGMIIGDAAKSKQGSGHRHIGLVLSKKYETNLKIGDFTCLCANAAGLRMHRTEDLARPPKKPHGFFQ
jgi:hypothetical protein